MKEDREAGNQEEIMESQEKIIEKVKIQEGRKVRKEARTGEIELVRKKK